MGPQCRRAKGCLGFLRIVAPVSKQTHSASSRRNQGALVGRFSLPRWTRGCVPFGLAIRSRTAADDVAQSVAKRSVASMIASMMPGSDAAWPASGMSRNSASGQA
jgi:hypothetical protein